jgi:hypothetical protein
MIDRAVDRPDEIAISLVYAAGQLLRTVADRRVDEADVNQVLGELMDAEDQGAQIGGVAAPLDQLALLVSDPDSANRFSRMLIHALHVCLDYTPGAGNASYQRRDAQNREGTQDAQEIADEAAKELAKLVSPYGVMMLMMLGAFKQATEMGMSPLQVINAVGSFSEVVLCTSCPIVARLDEGAGIPGFTGFFTAEQSAANQPNMDGTMQFLRSMGWKAHPSEPESRVGLMPLVAIAASHPVGIPILSVGYSPTDMDSEFAIMARKANAYEFEKRNTDVLLISTKPVSISHGGTNYSVIGEVFVRKDGERSKRVWRPAVAWPGCSITELVDLARSPLFDMNESECSDPQGAVLLKLTKALAAAGRRGR